MDFEVVALTASGDMIRDANLDFTWWSTNPTVFTVEDDGTATGQSSGTALCKVEATEEEASKVTRLFSGRDSVFVSVF